MPKVCPGKGHWMHYIPPLSAEKNAYARSINQMKEMKFEL